MSSPSASDAPPPALAFDPDARTPGAWAVIAGLVGAHVVTAVLYAEAARTSLPWALVLNRSTRLRLLAGGQYAPLVEHEPWRLVRSVGLHADAGHLLVNALALWVLGRLLEPWVGSVRFAWWFLIAGVGGSLASHGAGMLQSDGASGGAFGLLGAALVLGLRHRDRLPPEDRAVVTRWIPVFVVGNLVLSLILPFVDAVGHLGGLGVGMALGGMARPERPSAAVTTLEAAAAGLLVVLAVFGPALTG